MDPFRNFCMYVCIVKYLTSASFIMMFVIYVTILIQAHVFQYTVVFYLKNLVNCIMILFK